MDLAAKSKEFLAREEPKKSSTAANALIDKQVA
jgi:hypothetical protein